MAASYAAPETSSTRTARDATEYLRRGERLKSLRANFDSHWQEVAERVIPSADNFWNRRNYGGVTGGGEKRNERIYDSTAVLALQKFGAILQSLLTPSQQWWHRLRTSNEQRNQDPAAKEWFDTAVRILFAMRQSPRANYDTQMQTIYKSHGAFGNGCLFVDEDPRGGVRYKQLHISQLYIACDHQGRVDTVYRYFNWTAHQAVQKWGRAAGPKVNEALEKQPWREFEFLHAVQPRSDRDPDSFGPRSKPFEGLYISCEDKQVIEEGGYERQPYIYSRWVPPAPGEVYARGPGMDVLPAIKVVNQEKRTFLRAGHNAVDPALLVHDEGIFGLGVKQPRIVPGSALFNATTSDGKPLVVPLNTGARLDITREMMEDEQKTINESFFVNLFRILVEDPEMTATEVLERAQEKGQLLGPSVSNLQSELLGPQIEREISILMEQGILPPLPPVLQEAGEYDIEYVAPANRLQRAEQTSGISRTMEIAAPLAAADPTLWLVFDGEQIVRSTADTFGVPGNQLRTPEQFAELRQQMQQAQAQAQAMASAQQMASAGKDGADAISSLQGASNGGAAA